MAVAKVKKIQIIAHKDKQDSILEGLQDAGLLLVSDVRNLTSQEDIWKIFTPNSPLKDLGLDETINELEFSIHYISSFEDEKSRMIRKKYHVKKDEFNTIIKFDHKDIYKKCTETEYTFKEIDTQINQLTALTSELNEWKGLNIPLSKISPTQETDIFLGIIDIKIFDSLIEELDKKSLVYDIKVIREDKTRKRKFILFVCHRSGIDSINKILKKFDFKHIYFPDLEKTPVEEIDRLKKNLNDLRLKKNLVIKDMRLLLKECRRLSLLHDYLYNLRNRFNTKFFFGQTNSTILINGWIKDSNLKEFRYLLSKFPQTEAIISEPLKDDIVPVDLENPKIIQPFEFITRIYGLPKYGELDATPFLAPFFFIFFGFCLTDAGYGLIISLLSIFVLFKFKFMGRNAKLFFKLLFLGGISTLVLGSLTGGWFGNLIDMLAQKNTFFGVLQKGKNLLMLLDPTEEPLKLLVIALTLGVMQIWWGHISAIIGNFKNKRFLDIFLDQGSVLTFLFGFTGLILSAGGLLDKGTGRIFCYTTWAGAILIVITQGRSQKGIGGKIFNGAFSLYGTASGYISDVLSYSRLWALGLVTGVMAMTCNLIGFMIGEAIPFVGFFISFLILLIGHSFTIAINVLGALVHSARLQFVEFFPKFYKSGGKAFVPLKIENKYTIAE